MQDRIKQMAEEAGFIDSDGLGYYTKDSGAFECLPSNIVALVQAVARECAEICRDLANTDAHDYNDVRNECGNAIRARFGIKE